jgi:hypothetical protein
MSQDQGRQLLDSFKPFFSPFLFAALEEPSALMLIANKQINLDRIKNENNCYTLSFLLNEAGYACLQKNHITLDSFLSVPTHERYTLHYLFNHGLELLEKGVTNLKTFLDIPEKKRQSYIDNLKQT